MTRESQATPSTWQDLRGRHTCSVPQAAALLGIGRSTAYKAAHDGTLPVLRISNRVLVSVSRLGAMLGMEDAEACERSDRRSATARDGHEVPT